MGWFSKRSKDEMVDLSITTIVYEPTKDKEASQPVEPTEHENQYYCGLCGWSDIQSFPHRH